MPFSRRSRPDPVPADAHAPVSSLPSTSELNPVGRSVVEIDSGRWWGIDVAIAHPDVRSSPDGAGEGVWSARDLLTEIGGRRDLVEINTGLLTTALRAVAEARPPVDGTSANGPGRAVVAVHPRFAVDEEFLPTVKTAVRRSGLDPAQLLLSVAADDLDRQWPAVQRLRSHGVKVALEVEPDSLEATEELLHRLSFDLVRLSADAALTGSPAEAEPTTLVRQLLANDRRVWVEDVADAALLDQMDSIGCSLASGSAVDRPLDHSS